MTSTCAILASDFSHRTTDTDRHEWTPGKMRHLIAGLKGTPVALTVDRLTGHTMLGVTLDGLRQTPGYGTYQVLVSDVLEDGTIQRTWFSLFSLGVTIVPLTEAKGTSAKYLILAAFAEEGSRATRKLAAMYEGTARNYGACSAAPGSDYVDVTYAPAGHSPEATNLPGYHRFKLTELA